MTTSYRQNITVQGAHVIVCNDDGPQYIWDEVTQEHKANETHEGHQRLLNAIRKSGPAHIWDTTPATQQSGMGTAIKTGQYVGYEVHKSNSKETAMIVQGTPADSVLAMINYVQTKGHDPKEGNDTWLCLSGCNWGTNLGNDVTPSGTVGCAKYASNDHKIRSVAFSFGDLRGEGLWEETTKSEWHWDAAEKVMTDLIYLIGQLPEFGSDLWKRKCYLNINIPDLPLDEIRAPRVTVSSYFDKTSRLEDDRVVLDVPKHSAFGADVSPSRTEHRVGKVYSNGRTIPTHHTDGDIQRFCQGHVTMTVMRDGVSKESATKFQQALEAVFNQYEDLSFQTALQAIHQDAENKRLNFSGVPVNQNTPSAAISDRGQKVNG